MKEKTSFFERLKNRIAPPEKAPRRKKQPAAMEPDNTLRIGLTIDNLKAAVDAAEDVYNPTRNDLYLLYKQARKDGHVQSQFRIAVNKVASLPFRVYQGDSETEDLKYIFKRPWFDAYLTLMVECELMGYTLLDFSEIKDGEFVSVKAFPRRYVIPNRREMITHPAMLRGVSYEGLLDDLYMIEAGDVDDLGTMQLVTLETIYKNFARADWSDFNERFGKPIVDMATDTSDEEETRKKSSMAANFGSNLWIVRDFDDEVNILEAKNVGGNAANFEKAIKLADEYISKIVNGQAGTSDEKSFVGSAEVGERILNDFTKQRVRAISNHINYVLIPFMVRKGYPLQDCTFEFVIEEVKPEEAKQQQAEPVNRLVSQKKNYPNLSLHPKHYPVAAFKLEDWLLRYFQGTTVGIDASMWELTFRRLLRALEDVKIDFGATYQYADLARLLREDAAVYAAFKNHDEQKALAKLLVDADGKPVDWNTFKKAAKPLTEQYNREWLQTEYSQAQASAQMAVKWEGFQEAKDLYPNLRYDAVMDDFTRDEHEALDGTILPIDDPFWDRNYPPNGWGCRCSVSQTDKPATQKPTFKADGGFSFNPGKDRRLFAPDAGYRANVDENTSEAITAQGQSLLDEYLRSNG